MSIDALREHEANLVAFGRYMVSPDRSDPEETDMAEIGRLAARVINGIPAVRAALNAVSPEPLGGKAATPDLYVAIQLVRAYLGMVTPEQLAAEEQARRAALHTPGAD